MNKTLRFFFLLGLAAILSTSCNKVQPTDSFSVSKNPETGGTITLYKVENGTRDSIPYPDLLTVGDSLVLTATPKNGYTFINWLKDGKNVSTNPSYEFVVLGGMEKCQFEANFGLDYALQVIPPIDEVMPKELVAIMGPYLHFGDNPPRIDTCFYADSLRLARFVHNLDDPTTTYFLLDSQYFSNRFFYQYYGQHRGVADSCRYERAYGDISYGLGFYMFENGTADENIYIMGNEDGFTIYYKQTCKKRMEPDESLSSYISDFNVHRDESVIITGRVTPQGIADFRMGMCVEGYSESSPRIGQLHYLPAKHDIFIYDYPNNYFRYTSSF